MFKLQFLPGWGLMFVLALVSTQLSRLIEVGGKHPLEAGVIAILLGILFRNRGYLPQICKPGVKAFEKVLILGIVLLGAGLDYANILSQGWKILSIVLIDMTVGLVVIYWLAKRFDLTRRLSLLLALGTTICGGTAIAVTSPLINAKEEETSYAIGTIALWGLVGIIFYPYLAQLFGVSDVTFGIFAGTAIHSTAQVVGAGFIYSNVAGQTATAVKLVRNCFLAPAALFCMLWYARAEKQQSTKGKFEWTKGFPWFLFAYFVMAWLNSQGYFDAETVKTLSQSGKFFILLGMVGVGLNTDFGAFRSVGVKPLVVGCLGSVVVALTSIGLLLVM